MIQIINQIRDKINRQKRGWSGDSEICLTYYYYWEQKNVINLMTKIATEQRQGCPVGCDAEVVQNNKYGGDRN